MSITAQNITPNKLDKKPISKSDYDKMRARDRELVKGKFIFHEVPGGVMSFVFRAYRGDEVERYDLVDGQIYTIPLGVARHLNKNCWYPEYGYVKGEGNTQSGINPESNIMRISRKIRRCSFQSLEFIDMDDLTPTSDIVTAQTVYSSGIPN